MRKQWNNTIIIMAAAGLASLCLPRQARAEEEKPSYTLLSNARIFDGENDRLTPGSVLIENNLIKSVGSNVRAPQGATVIDCGGRTLMPGLIDGHAHIAINANYPDIEANFTAGDLHVRSVVAAQRSLAAGHQ